jgi:hypothetical protein
MVMGSPQIEGLHAEMIADEGGVDLFNDAEAERAG